MSDIVERLRAVSSTEIAVMHALTREAADEIERLRNLAQIVREQGFEIERLRDHMRALADTSVDRDTAGIFKGLWHGSEKECDQLRAEIERLLEQVASLQASSGYEASIAQLEIEQLRAALQTLLNEVMCFSVDPPSAALNHAIEEAGRALCPGA